MTEGKYLYLDQINQVFIGKHQETSAAEHVSQY